MAKYLLQGVYTGAAAAGLLKEGGESRVKAIHALVASVGGTMVSEVYYGFGEMVDVFAIGDFPDHSSAAALTLIAAPAGVKIKTTVLMEPAEIDAAIQKNPSYRAPGA